MPLARRFFPTDTRPLAVRRIYRALPVHLENTKFPTVGPQALNLSTRGLVSTGDNVLIGGFIITGTEPKT